MKKKHKGFSLIEAVLVMAVIASSFLAFGYLFGNVDQQALKSDLTILATKLAREEMDAMMQQKADSGYAAIVSNGPTAITSGTWPFTRTVTVSYVNPLSAVFAPPAPYVDSGYKKVEINVSWAAGAGNSVTLTTLVTNMVPSAVGGGATCP